MMAAKMALCGWGIYSDQFTNAGALSQVVKRLIGNADVTISNVLPAHATTSRFPDLELTINALDAVSQYAFRALHEALCNAEPVTPDRTALLLLSAWGPTENTLNFFGQHAGSGWTVCFTPAFHSIRVFHRGFPGGHLFWYSWSMRNAGSREVACLLCFGSCRGFTGLRAR